MDTFKALGLLLTTTMLAVYAADIKGHILQKIDMECDRILKNDSFKAVREEYVPKPTGGAVQCPVHFFCLAERALKHNEDVRRDVLKLTRLIQSYNNITHDTKCTLKTTNVTYKLELLLKDIVSCS